MEQFSYRIREYTRILGSKLRPHPLNWRTHPIRQQKALRAALNNVGIAGVLLVYVSEEAPDQYTVIDGHGRIKFAPHIEWPCVVLDVNDQEAMTLLLTYDPISALAGVDPQSLTMALERQESDDPVLVEFFAQLATQASLANHTGDMPPFLEIDPDMVDIEDDGDEDDELQDEAEVDDFADLQFVEEPEQRPMAPERDEIPLRDQEALLIDVWGVAVGQQWTIPSLTRLNTVHRWYISAAPTIARHSGVVLWTRRAVPQEMSFLLSLLCDGGSLWLGHEPQISHTWNTGLINREMVFQGSIQWVFDRPLANQGLIASQHKTLWYWTKGDPIRQGTGPMNDVWPIDLPERYAKDDPVLPVHVAERLLEWSSHEGDTVLHAYAGLGSMLIAAEQRARVCIAWEPSLGLTARALERFKRLGLTPYREV